MDQGSSFTSKAVKEFCNTEGIENDCSPVNNHIATVCVERTIGSIKNFVLTYAKEKNHGKIEAMVKRAPGVLRVAPNASIKVSPFEAQHGREAITVLLYLTSTYRILIGIRCYFKNLHY